MNAEEKKAIEKTLKELIEIKKQQNAELEKSIENKDKFMFFIEVCCIITGICSLIWLTILIFIC